MCWGQYCYCIWIFQVGSCEVYCMVCFAAGSFLVSFHWMKAFAGSFTQAEFCFDFGAVICAISGVLFF